MSTTDPFSDDMPDEPKSIEIPYPLGAGDIDISSEEIVDNLVHWLLDGMPDDVPSKD